MFLEDIDSTLLQVVLDKLQAAGVKIEKEKTASAFRPNGELRCVDVSTAPFPGFPTDMQAQFMALMCRGARAFA